MPLLIENLSIEEQDVLSEIFVDIYLNGREELPNGIEKIKEYNKKVKEFVFETQENVLDNVIENKIKPTSFIKMVISFSTIPDKNNLKRIMKNIVPVVLKGNLTKNKWK